MAFTELNDFSAQPSIPSASSSSSSVTPSSSQTARTRKGKGRPKAARRSGLKSTLATTATGLLLAVAGGIAGVEAQRLNNVTALTGTWSTGTGHVITGSSFFNPVQGNFTWPQTAGQSYSFTDDGHWEQLLYLYETNSAKPQCVGAQLIWQHGTYTINRNGSLTLTPYAPDGKQSVANRCASQSTNIQYYAQQEYMSGFDITLGSHYGRSGYRLQLYQFDGSLKPAMWQVYNPPMMLPTEQLHEQVFGQVAG